MGKTRNYLFISLLVAQGVVLGLLENMIPYPFAFAPGAKLGLANLITVISLFTMRKREVFCSLLATFIDNTARRHCLYPALQYQRSLT